MRELHRTEVPLTEAEDINRPYTTWRGGKCVAIDEGKYVTLYVDHRIGSRADEDGGEIDVCMASPIRLAKPVSRDMAINAAEMAAYGLADAMAVASFNASLARKSRLDPTDAEVTEHDAFISWIKDRLTDIGV